MPHYDHLVNSNMLLIFQIEQWVVLLISAALIAIKGYALVNALMFSAESYPAADKLTKVLWVLILAFGLFTAVLFFGSRLTGIFQLIFTTAAFVFLCDVKPALSDLRR
jgi:purine-cytosine permease-like protein